MMYYPAPVAEPAPGERPADNPERFLEGVQANIVKGHSRLHGRYVMFRFKNPQRELDRVEKKLKGENLTDDERTQLEEEKAKLTRERHRELLASVQALVQELEEELRRLVDKLAPTEEGHQNDKLREEIEHLKRKLDEGKKLRQELGKKLAELLELAPHAEAERPPDADKRQELEEGIRELEEQAKRLLKALAKRLEVVLALLGAQRDVEKQEELEREIRALIGKLEKANSAWQDVVDQLKMLNAGPTPGHQQNRATADVLQEIKDRADSQRQRKHRLALSALADKVLTSATEQLRLTEEWRAGRKSGNVGVIGLTSKGYRQLGISGEYYPPDEEFRGGILPDETTGGYVNQEFPWDRAADEWDDDYWDKKDKRVYDIDGLIHLAGDKEPKLNTLCVSVEEDVKRFAHIVGAPLEGKRKIHDDVDPKRPIEHFGFVDGIANPKYADEDYPARIDWAFVQEPVLPGVKRSFPSYGSYGVFLKLEQNVKEFKEKARELQSQLRGCPVHSEALAMGRHHNGRPLVPDVGRGLDEFDYARDRDPLPECPVHAHVRRMNPRRNSLLTMVRRGMNYGPDRNDLCTDPTGASVEASNEYGLLFLSYQREIRRFSSRMYAALSPKSGGVDALLGREIDGKKPAPQMWRDADGNEVKFSMSGFVTPRGGEYFFFPSMYFFRDLPAVGLGPSGA